MTRNIYHVVRRGVVIPRLNSLLPVGDTELISRGLFRTRTYVRETRVTVGLTPTQILTKDEDRLFWKATNRSAADSGTIGFDRFQLTLINGEALPPLNYISMDVKDDGEGVTQEVFGIMGVAPATWYITETLAK